MLSYFARCFGFRSDRRSREIRLHPTRRPLRLEALEDRRLLSAAPYVVDSLEDVVAEDGVVTLREAIEAANTNTVVGDAHAGSAEETDVITFAPELLGGTIALEKRHFAIAESIAIRGPGADALTIDASDSAFGFFMIDAGEVSISGVTIQNSGQAGIFSYQSDLAISDAVFQGCGGSGILTTDGTLAVTDSIFTENVGDYGGGLSAEGTWVNIAACSFADNTANSGGAIGMKDGSLTVADCSFTHNIAHGTGGGVSVLRSTLAVENCMITGNSSGGHGGGIYAGTDMMTVQNSTISENASGQSGGGINCGGDMIRITDCHISGNVAVSTAGGLYSYAHEATILTGCSIVDNSVGSTYAFGGGIYGYRLHISNCTVSGNQATYLAGGIAAYESLTLIQSTVADNEAARAGGFWCHADSPVTMFNSVVAL